MTCTARQVGERLESGRLNRLDTNSNFELVEDLDDRPVDMKTLFWSYFHRGSVERSGLFSSGYNRASPRMWLGRARLKSNFGDEVMLLGEMARVSQGPRRRRREVKRYPGAKELGNPPRWQRQDSAKRMSNSWQGKNIVSPAMLPPMPRHLRNACTRLCGSSPPPPGFPPCCHRPAESSGMWQNWLETTQHFVHSHPVAVIAIQTVFTIAVINVLVSRLDESGVSGRSWEEEKEEEEPLLLRISDWLSALEEHAMEKNIKGKKKKEESYICCVHNVDKEEKVQCFPQPRKSSEQFRFPFLSNPLLRCRRGICQMFYTRKIPNILNFTREKRKIRDIFGEN